MKTIQLPREWKKRKDSTPKAKETENEHATPEWTESNMGGISALLVLLSPELIRSTLLLWVVFFGNAFSYYGLVLLTTELNNGHNNCADKLQSEKPQDIDYKDVFITSFAEFPGLLLSAAIVDKLGRKLSMSAMFFCCCAFLLPLLFQQSEGLTTGLLFGARICISGSFTIVYIYAPEVREEFMSCFHGKFIFLSSVAQRYLLIKKSPRKNAFQSKRQNFPSLKNLRMAGPNVYSPIISSLLKGCVVILMYSVYEAFHPIIGIYPTSVRTTGVGVASAIGRIGGMACPLVAVALVHGCHQTAAIVLFEIVIFLSAIATLLFPLETTGRELIDSVASSKLVMH
ncbi:hypothetical protein Pint_32415 [Pistacia integerrima]|uniref:Uncharacterized protein n=1 Tax=Pistacia integerrima TaxID=434235 RepID=A0ACC0XQ83_9ROSI|nr:hypothetical protein Pint_32415 [Pistacia integerrima]